MGAMLPLMKTLPYIFPCRVLNTHTKGTVSSQQPRHIKTQDTLSKQNFNHLPHFLTPSNRLMICKLPSSSHQAYLKHLHKANQARGHTTRQDTSPETSDDTFPDPATVQIPPGSSCLSYSRVISSHLQPAPSFHLLKPN